MDKPGQGPVGSDKWKLTKAQKDALLSWIGEGLTPREANKRAAAFRPAFTVSRQLIAYYRDRIGVPAVEARKATATAAFNKGFCLKDNRLRALDKLARRMLKDLSGEDRGLWLEDKKTVGAGEDAEVYVFERFNSSQLNAFRDLLDDIAREVGARNARTLSLETDGPIGRIKFVVGVNPEDL